MKIQAQIGQACDMDVFKENTKENGLIQCGRQGQHYHSLKLLIINNLDYIKLALLYIN